MANRTIQPVTDNRDKQRTYSEQMGRYARAMRGAFYLEALLIDYAMLEDRLYLHVRQHGRRNGQAPKAQRPERRGCG